MLLRAPMLSHAAANFSLSQNMQRLPVSGLAGCPILVVEKRQPTCSEKPMQNLLPLGAGRFCLSSPDRSTNKATRYRKEGVGYVSTRIQSRKKPFMASCLRRSRQLLLHPLRRLHGFPASCWSLLCVEPGEACDIL